MELAGKNVVVVGLGKSGLSAARFALSRGARVAATDSKPESETAVEVRALGTKGARLFFGGNPPSAFEGAQLVAVSPGVPLSLPVLEDVRRRGVPVVGDVEFASWYLSVPALAVTGTNGKSTVTSLLGQIVRAAGRKPFVGANLGTPVFEAIGADFDSLVLELSSYQIETLASLHPRVAVLLNVSDDHLDRYPSFEHYRRAKARLLSLVPEDGCVVSNLDNPPSMDFPEGLKARRKIGFTMEGRGAPEGWERVHAEGRAAVFSGGERIDLSRSPLVGRHNLANLLAAAAAARAFGISAEAVGAGVAAFQGLPHRCEFVAEVGGVKFYDDSKGTNVDAVVQCLKGFETPVVLIAGGVGKGGSYAPLAEAGRGRLRHAVLIGEEKSPIARALSGVCPTAEAPGMQEAVRLAARAARPGESVVLSPACSSFDMFRDYADRGDRFQAAVRSLRP